MRNGGKWSEARFKSFIVSTLRRASMRWPPKGDVKKEARVSRGIYYCKGCKENVTASIKVSGKRVQNVFVDHIEPVVNPHIGFTSWDTFINNLFCEADNLQVLCKNCHDLKTKKEKLIAKERVL